MPKAAKSCTVIGGADGPTSIFIAGKNDREKNIFKRLKSYILNKRYHTRMRQIKKKITPNGHTLEETIQYIKETYKAVLADASYPNFTERKKSMRFSLLQCKRPELLNMGQRISPPKNFEDENEVREWWKVQREWIDECQRRADEISYEVFKTEYYLFFIDKGEQGVLEVEIDTCFSQITISYSGEKKCMEPILRDIYLYYGVFEEDILNETERYQSLIGFLSC